MSQFSARAIDPAQTDALLEVVTQQITLLTFDDRDEEMLARLVGCLADPREEAQTALANTFGEIGEAATEILVAGLLTHPIAVARRGCGRSLAKVRNPDAVPGLIHALLKDTDPRVKSAVASALVAIGAPAVPGLLEIIGSDAGMTEMGQAAWALAHMDTEALPKFYEAIESPLAAVRSAVVTAVGSIVKGRVDRLEMDPRAVNLLLNALDDGDAMVRLEAVNAIATIGLKSAVEKVMERLKDDHEEVRRAAAIALGKLGDRSALVLLDEVARGDGASAVRILAKLAIGAIGERSNEA